ncbi:CidA/LrgA family protein [Acerihabitans sp. TG2]|nr:CidA/LrgA family protein [Acerihabitans sp. TG2]MEA9392879.1 CidA/LrgA family protein [Acerihabitans sp. TG2]
MLLSGRVNMLLRRVQCQLPAQLIVYIGLFMVSQRLVERFHLPLPANVIGMFLLLALILSGLLPVQWVSAGARWLLAEMLLFFVPAVVAVINYTQLLMLDGWRIFLVIAISTALVLGTTGLVVERVYRFELWLARRKPHHG